MLKCRWKVGQRVRLVGTKRVGTVLDVISDINLVVFWKQNSPQFIVVCFDDEPDVDSHCSNFQLKGVT
jgi:hypothetical protein